MQEGYYNYYTRLAESWWERRDFVRGWRRLHAGDRRWVPPYFPKFTAALNPERTPHVSRQRPAFVWIEALQGRPNAEGSWTGGNWNAQRFNSVFMEEAVAVAALMADPRRVSSRVNRGVNSQVNNTATLALLSVANDVESLERLLTVAQEQAFARGRSRLVGPVALSPHLGYGALLDHFDQTPPLYTPYNAPYMPEILDSVLERVQTARLYHAAVSPHVQRVDGRATLRPLCSGQNGEDDTKILPNLLSALDDNDQFPRPDAVEAEFLLSWWDVAPILGWIAEVEGEAVGFMLLQPDLGAALRRAKGGHNPFWQLWWQWRRTQPTRNGRIVAGGVLPQWRRQGIGRQLWAAALNTAHLQGWRSVSIGPVADDSAAASFLLAHHAQPLQHYALYGTE